MTRGEIWASGLVVRRTHVCASRNHAAHHEAFDGFVAGCGSRLDFLAGVACRSGQQRGHHIRVAFTGKTAGSHPEGQGNVSYKLGKRAQHRIDPEIERRWGSYSVCGRLCLYHVEQYRPDFWVYEK
jgi:hypothetical protein